MIDEKEGRVVKYQPLLNKDTQRPNYKQTITTTLLDSFCQKTLISESLIREWQR